MLTWPSLQKKKYTEHISHIIWSRLTRWVQAQHFLQEMFIQRRHRAACTSAHSDQRLRCPHENASQRVAYVDFDQRTCNMLGNAVPYLKCGVLLHVEKMVCRGHNGLNIDLWTTLQRKKCPVHIYHVWPSLIKFDICIHIKNTVWHVLKVGHWNLYDYSDLHYIKWSPVMLVLWACPLFFIMSSNSLKDIHIIVTKTCLYNFDRLKPHFYI